MYYEIIQCTMKWKGSCLRNWWGWGPHDDSTEYMDGVKVKVYYICCADGSGGPGGPRSPTIRLFPNLDRQQHFSAYIYTYIHFHTYNIYINIQYIQYIQIFTYLQYIQIYTNIYDYIQIYIYTWRRGGCRLWIRDNHAKHIAVCFTVCERLQFMW